MKGSWTVGMMAGMLALALAGEPARGGIVRTQELALSPGWNAVYLEVSPATTDPDVLFGEVPVDMAASCFEATTPTQFMTDPNANMLRDMGWGVWYAADRPDAFLRTLDAIHGQRAYMVHATTAATWRVTGEVDRAGIRWQPRAYNLVGFPLDAEAPPTFRQFFAGSAAHDTQRIYRLVGGTWRRVTAPDAVGMRSGEAFWVYCTRATTYQGPLEVATGISHALLLDREPDAVTLRNTMDHPVTVTFTHLPGASRPAVPLSFLIRVVGDTREPLRTVSLDFPVGEWSHTLPPLEAGAALRIPVEARSGAMTEAVHASLLKLSTDLGTETWIPVLATREDMKEQ